MTTELKSFSDGVAAIVARLGPGVAAVHSHRARCSGFHWKPGLVVTSDEGLADEGDVQVVLADGTSVGATIAGRDPGTDVALLKIPRQDLSAVPLAADIPPVGSLAITIGRHEGAETAALGIVSASGGRWASMRGGEIDARLDLDLRLRPSAEGGLAVDAAGRVFGMAVHGPRRRVLVIPSATINRIAARLEQQGRIARGYLGLALQPIAVEAGGGSGAIVMNVDPKGPAAAAGIHQGDVLISWNGKPLDRLRPLLRSLGPDAIGQPLALEVRRGGAVLPVTLVIAERPQA